MADERRSGARNACPHCGQPPGLRWWYLLPTNNRNRALKCDRCGGKYDVSDGSKIASIMGGLLGIGPAILLLGQIVKYGHGSAASIAAGTAAAAALFMAGSVVLGRLTLQLVSKA
jgi:hypothetical protein